jgi:hypothetical protein
MDITKNRGYHTETHVAEAFVRFAERLSNVTEGFCSSAKSFCTTAKTFFIDAKRIFIDAKTFFIDAKRIFIDAKTFFIDAERIFIDAETFFIDAEPSIQEEKYEIHVKDGYKTPWASVRGVFLCEEVAASQCPAINGDVKYYEYEEDPLYNDGGEYISIF